MLATSDMAMERAPLLQAFHSRCLSLQLRKQALSLVLRQVGRAQDSGQLAQFTAAPQVNLKQAVARSIEALHEEGVRL